MNLTEFLPLDKSPATAAVMAAVAKAEARHFSLPPPHFLLFFFSLSHLFSLTCSQHTAVTGTDNTPYPERPSSTK